MPTYGVCRVCEAVVRTTNFTAHRTFHKEAGTRDPGPHGYHEIEEALSVQRPAPSRGPPR